MLYKNIKSKFHKLKDKDKFYSLDRKCQANSWQSK